MAKQGDDKIKRTEYNKDADLSNVNVRPSFKSTVKVNMERFMSNGNPSDYQNTKATTAAGSALRGINKAASTVVRAAASPVALATSVLGATVDSIKNQIASKKEQSSPTEKTKRFSYGLDN